MEQSKPIMGCPSQSTVAARRAPALALVAVAVLVGASPARAGADQKSWAVAQPPAWVQDLPLPAAGTLPKTVRSGRLYLLVDHEVRVGSPTVHYHRRAWMPLSTEGVQNASEIEIDFDPTYQRLVIHHVRLLRDGRDVFSFIPADVRVIQQETDLAQQIYSGELTAVVFIRDLRPGDIVDYAYSVEGTNPILDGHFDDELRLTHGPPVRLLRHAVHVPSRTVLHIQARNTAIVPRVETAGAWRTYTWEARDVAEEISDRDEPGWFDPDPRVEVTTFESWAEVARWATELFEKELRSADGSRRLAEKWRAAPGGGVAAADEATRFVQDEVRYLGIEMGPNSHQPHPPDQVLRQRFGDCKDKAVLLVALLRALGIDAAAALVNTTRRRGLDDVQPSPFAFDHVIVQAMLDGRAVWIDATESGKGGRVEAWDAPEFERALVLRPGTLHLAAIPRPEPREPLVDVTETYTLGARGKPTRLDVVTTYRGTEADAMRRRLATTSREDLAKRYLDYYAQDNADIKAVRPPASHDDRARNVVRVEEAYEMAAFWKEGERELFAWEVRENLPKTASSTRTTPLAVPHPVYVTHHLVVRARSAFRWSNRHETITDDAFVFTSDRKVAGPELRLSFEYRSRADSVAPPKIKAHQQAVDGVKDALGVVISDDMVGAGGGAVALALLLTIVGLLLGGGAAAWLRARIRARRLAAFALEGRPGSGETAAGALVVMSEAQLSKQVAGRKCACGARGTMTEGDRVSAVYDGRRLTVLHLRCEKCGTAHDLYALVGEGGGLREN